MLRIIHGLAIWVAGMSMIVNTVGGVAIHLFTVWIAFKASGIIAAVLTLIFPLLGTLFWIFRLWDITGVFWHFLTLAAVAYLFVIAVMMGFLAIAAATEPSSR